MTLARRYAAEWARKAREATEARDRWIVAMDSEGASLRDIAKTTGISHTAVQRVLRKAKEVDSS